MKRKMLGIVCLCYVCAFMMIACSNADTKTSITDDTAHVSEQKEEFASTEEYFENAEFTDWEDSLIYENNEGVYVITGCSRMAENVRVPDEIDGIPVMEISEDAFRNCHRLRGVVLGCNVQRINASAFSDSGLEYILIPDSVTEIGKEAFHNTPLYENSQTDVVYADGWVVGCNTETTEIILSVDTKGIVDADIFRECKNVQHIELHGIKEIPESMFFGCSRLKTLVLGDDVEIIGENAFKSCASLSKVTLGNSIREIGSYAFSENYCLEEIILPESVTVIGEAAFQSCLFSSIVIPKNVTSIYRGAFDGCYKLQSITFENPECNIYEQTKMDTIPYEAVIYGYWGSTAEQYALDWYMDFEGLDDGNRNNSILATSALSVTDVELGSSFSAAITEDGSLYTWGNNENGALGQKMNTESQRTPQKILDDVVQLDTSRYSCAAVTEDGKLYMWGKNDENQLAMKKGKYGSSCDAPVMVMENVTCASAGDVRSAAVTADGILWTWGNGYPSPNDKVAGVRAVSVGERHIMYITDDNKLYAFGSNDLGQYGNGTVEKRDKENRYVKFHTNEVLVMENVAEVSAGDDFTAAVTLDGSLYTWGSNKYGQLGDGTREDSAVPVKIMDNIKTVSVNGWSMIALTNDGEVYVFDGRSQVSGNDTVISVEMDGQIPVKVMDNAVAVSCGSGHYAAVDTDGKLYMWGSNDAGQLGDGTTNDSEAPIEVYIIAQDSSEE